MKGDFSRRTFDRQRHFRSVRMQRGRVQLDADWNEQAEVLLYRLETLAADLIGPSGTLVEPMSYTWTQGSQAPSSGTGRVRTSGKMVFGFGTRFTHEAEVNDKITVGGQIRSVTKILTDSSLTVAQAFSPDLPFPYRNFRVSASGAGSGLVVAAGRYFVDGLLCELEADTLLENVQPDLPGYDLPTADGFYLAYLDAWEEHVTALDDAGLADPALGGADTATRSRVRAQMKLVQVVANATADLFPPGWNPGGDPVPPPVTLAARSAGTPLDNQLFRVEIHQGGGLGQATFKWSRDNGVAVAAVGSITGKNLTLTSPPSPAPEKLFAAGQWVEVTSREAGLRGEPGVMARLLRVQGSVLTVEEWPGPGHPVPTGVNRVRRWDSPGEVPVAVPADNDGYLALAEGIEVRFAGTADAVVATGDYWLIPSRAAAGVLWPVDPDGEPAARQPDGIRHHYAPLQLFRLTTSGTLRTWAPVDGGDCRGLFEPAIKLSSDAKVSRSGDTMDVNATLRIQSDLFVTGQAHVGGVTTPPAGVKLAVSGGPLRVQPGSGLSFPSQAGSTASLRYVGSTSLVAAVTDPSNAAHPGSLRLFQNQADRMVFAGGRVGIGVAEPTVDLDVGGLLRTRDLTVTGTLALVDGSQQAGLVLTASNDAGSASWQPVPQPAIFQPVFFDTPIAIESGASSEIQRTFSFGSALKSGTSAVILEASAVAGGPNGGAVDSYIRVRDKDPSPWLAVLRGRSAGSGDIAAWAGQAVCSVAEVGNDFQIQYSVQAFEGDPNSPVSTGPAFDGGWSLRVVGYFLGR